MSEKKTQTKSIPEKNQTKRKPVILDWFNLEDQELKKYQNLKNKPKASKYGIFKQPKSRMILLGDIHGDFDALETILVEQAEVLEKKIHNEQNYYRWIGGNTWVVCLGDLIDRCREESIFEQIQMLNHSTGKYETINKSIGEDSTSEMKVLDLLNMTMIQAEKSGGKLIKIIGNHDFESIPGGVPFFYTAYSSPYFYYHTLNTLYETKKITLQNYQAVWNTLKTSGAPSNQIKSYLRQHYFGINQILNCKLRAGNAFLVIQIGDWIMAHGGILRNMIEYYYNLNNPQLNIPLNNILKNDERLSKYLKSKKNKSGDDGSYDESIDDFVTDITKFENPWVDTLSGKSWIQILNKTFYEYAHGTLNDLEKNKFRSYLQGEYLNTDSVIYDRSLGDHCCNTEQQLGQYHFELYQKIVKLQLFHFKKNKDIKIAIAHCPQIANVGMLSKSYLPDNVTRKGHSKISTNWIETRIDNRKDQRYTYYSGISGDLPDQNGIPKLWRLDVGYSRAFDSKPLNELVDAIEKGYLEMFPALVRLLHARAPQCLEVGNGNGIEPRILSANPLKISRPWLKKYPKTLKLLETYINEYPLYPENPPYLIKMK
jgi:hypothetical protein